MHPRGRPSWLTAAIQFAAEANLPLLYDQINDMKIRSKDSRGREKRLVLKFHHVAFRYYMQESIYKKNGANNDPVLGYLVTAKFYLHI